jgi:hypothetical protein
MNREKMKLRVFIITIALVMLITGVTNSISSAYFVGNTWSSSQATYYYDSSLPINWRNGTDYGANVWTDVTTSSWVWSLSSGSSNLIKLGTIDGGGNILAVTTIWSSGNITKIEIKYDQAESWY